MTRVVPILCLGCVLAIGATAWSRLAAGDVADVVVPAAPPTAPPRTAPPPSPLEAARRTCSVAAVDAVVDELHRRCATDARDADAWHRLADAILERVQVRSHRRGITVGAPVWTELPREIAADVDAGLLAVAKARALGCEDGDLHRIEAGLMSQRITGLGTALQWNARIQEALARAAERRRDDPRLHVALGLRKLLAPKLLGHDPEAALRHFEFAAAALVDDERPAVFAAMASHLQKKRRQAVGWLERAVERNPANVFARVVLRRLVRDEDDPFGRHVTDEEAAAAR